MVRRLSGIKPLAFATLTYESAIEEPFLDWCISAFLAESFVASGGELHRFGLISFHLPTAAASAHLSCSIVATVLGGFLGDLVR